MKHWYKASSHLTIDPKLALIAERSRCYRCEVIALWVHLLEIANKVDEQGALGTLDFEVIDYTLGFTGGRAKKIYQFMEDKLVKDGQVMKWTEHQIDSTANERKRAQREREKSQNVTPCHSDNRDVTHVTLEETRVEEKDDSSLHSLSSRARGERIDPGLKLDGKYLEWASEHYPAQMDIMHVVFDEFKDYWLGMSGYRSTKLDWLATWRNRLKTVDFQQIRRNDHAKTKRNITQSDARGGRSTQGEIALGAANAAIANIRAAAGNNPSQNPGSSGAIG